MGLFSRPKKDNKNIQVESISQRNSNTAVNFAKSFEKQFDYSKNSIKDLEEILDYYSNDISESKPTENQIWSMAVIFGSYLGEVMLKNGLSERGYYWGTDNTSDIPLLMTDSGNCITPNDKVYKRLINGKEDNVITFYDVIMERA